ncbi:MAG: methionyl-tRNA formyltransferase [Gammaproteobacteria bacterium]|jgi:methionyl-tRNA formyltransferase
MTEPLRVVFAGTPDFAVPALDALIDWPGAEVVAVYTQPDRPAGRGRKLRPSPVKQRALEQGLPVCQPATLRLAEARRELAAFAPDLMIVVAYGLLLPADVLTLPRLGCLNIHASLLPRWRGAAPIQRAILAGDAETGISIMRMDEGLDTGPVLLARATPIGAGETGGELHDRLSRLGAEALIDALQGLVTGRLEPVIQDDRQASYARKLDKSEALVDWREPAEQIALAVRAFNPWPVCHTRWGGETLRIWAARALPEDARGRPGEVLSCTARGVDVATGRGVLRLLRLQLPGGRPLAVEQFANGRDLTGAVLG